MDEQAKQEAPQLPHSVSATQEKDVFLSGERVNLMLALCAIIISAASFYATYLQANAAERQVKAATWPWIQFGTGNFNKEQKKSELIFELSNSGAGPAHIKYVTFDYQGKTYTDIHDFLDDCCNRSEYNKALKSAQQKSNETVNYFDEFGWLLTSSTNNTLISAGQSINIMQMDLTKFNRGFWEKIDKARFELKTQACYCSLLDQCYISYNNSEVIEVEQCELPQASMEEQLATANSNEAPSG